MDPFLFATTQAILCEIDASARLGEICQQRNIQSVLLVTDPGIVSLGLHQSAVASLQNAQLACHVFADVQADPAEAVVLQAIKLAQQLQVDAIVGFGGGSSMDVAKIVALLAHPATTQSLADIYGVNQAKGARLPLIQIPTTAGTGSEVTQVAIVTTGETTKMGAVTPLFLPDLAILDAQLTVGLPAHITAATGIDAMVHAIEAYTSAIKKNPLSDLLAKEALRLLSANIETAVSNGQDLAARQNMLLGAMLAGQAFANAPVAAVHALAYPLGGHFHIPHGLSNSLVLPHVMRFNQSHCAHLYAQLAPLVIQAPLAGSLNHDQLASQVIHAIEQLIAALGLPTSLQAMNIPQDRLPTLAEDALLQGRLLQNNPRPVTLADALAIYQAAF